MDAVDEKAIKLCKKNKREGYDILFKKYERYIYSICYHYTNNKEDALDLMQEVFLKIYKAMDRFEEGRSMLPWIKRITINTCINYKRLDKGETVSLNQALDEGENALESFIADETDVEGEVILSDTKGLLREKISELPADMKMAVILRHMKDMSYEEISEVMSTPVGTVKTYLYRGRRLLKEKLVRYGVWEV